MENKNRTERPDSTIIQIKENYENGYWSKEYGISAEELKKAGTHIGVYDKIVDAFIEDKDFKN